MRTGTATGGHSETEEAEEERVVGRVAAHRSCGLVAEWLSFAWFVPVVVNRLVVGVDVEDEVPEDRDTVEELLKPVTSGMATSVEPFA